jgi:hypothetical protein
VDLELLNILSDEILRNATGADLINQAYLVLTQGHVIQRVRKPDGEIMARWDHSLNSPVMRVRSDDDTLLTLCSCQEFQREGTCLHVSALLVAWVMDRSSFVPVADDELASGERPSGSLAKKPAIVPAFDVAEDFRRILAQFTVAELREIARVRNVPISGVRKDPIVDALALASSQKDEFRQDWAKLSPEARLLGGLLPFIVTYLNTTMLGQAAEALGLKEQAINQAVENLRSFGIIAVDNYGGIQYPAVLPFWIPPDLDFVQVTTLDSKQLRAHLAPEPQSFYQAVTRVLVLLQAASEPYQARVKVRIGDTLKKAPLLREWPLDQQDVNKLEKAQQPYQLVQKEGVRVAPGPSLLTVEARQKLAAAMQTEPDRVDFIIRVLYAFNLIQITGGKPIRPAVGVIASVLQEESIQLLKQLLAGYVDLDDWTDFDLAITQSQAFRMILRNYNQGGYTRFLANAKMLRQKMFLLLRRVPAGQWYSLDSLAKRGSQLPLQLLLRSLLELEYFEINGRRVSLDRSEDVQNLLARFLESMLSGPLYWQGVVDLTWEKDRLAGFRVTPLGAALLAHPVDFQMPEPAEGTRSLVFTPDGNLILRLEAASSSLINLAILLGSVDVSRDGGVIIRPTLVGVGRAFEDGWTAERILSTLAEEAGRPVPPALADLLQKWWKNYGSVQIYQDVALMEFGDDYALGELLGGTSLSRYLLYRFSPRLIAIRPEGAQALRDELVKKGYTPKTV